jgi:hypothetical protein
MLTRSWLQALNQGALDGLTVDALPYNQEITDKYKESIMHYMKSQGAMLGVEACLKICRYLTVFGKKLEAAEIINVAVASMDELATMEKVRSVSAWRVVVCLIGLTVFFPFFFFFEDSSFGRCGNGLSADGIQAQACIFLAEDVDFAAAADALRPQPRTHEKSDSVLLGRL